MHQVKLIVLVLSSVHFACPASVAGRKDVFGLSGESLKGDDGSLLGPDLILSPDLPSTSSISLIPFKPLLASPKRLGSCNENNVYPKENIVPEKSNIQPELPYFLPPPKVNNREIGRGKKGIQCLRQCFEQAHIHPVMCQSLCRL